MQKKASRYLYLTKRIKTHKKETEKKNSFFLFYRLYIVKHLFSIIMNRIDEEEEEEEDEDVHDIEIMTGENNRKIKKLYLSNID
jgi:hypothetical protein